MRTRRRWPAGMGWPDGRSNSPDLPGLGRNKPVVVLAKVLLTIIDCKFWRHYWVMIMWCHSRGKSILESLGTTFLPNWQPPLIFVWFTSKLTWALAILLDHMHKKFDINRTKIKGGCQAGRKVVTHNSKSDLPLVSCTFLMVGWIFRPKNVMLLTMFTHCMRLKFFLLFYEIFTKKGAKKRKLSKSD